MSDQISPTEIKKCPVCGQKIVMVEYSYDNPKHYDGISEIICPIGTERAIDGTHFRIGRWCGKALKKGETENIFCNGKSSHKGNIAV